MGKIEWAMWANEQAIISCYVTLLGGILAVAGQFNLWGIGVYAVVKGILTFLLEYPRGKRQQGTSHPRRENQYRVLDVSKKLALFMCTGEDGKFKAKNITAKSRYLFGTVQNLKKKVQLNLGALSNLLDEEFDIPALKRREVDYVDDKVCDVSQHKKARKDHPLQEADINQEDPSQ
ncbi:hypothetical protein Btru_015557 [Bulinus truncatus]|nr:hypothetical protein Btru_015557 [Bulinus truncatus]